MPENVVIDLTASVAENLVYLNILEGSNIKINKLDYNSDEAEWSIHHKYSVNLQNYFENIDDYSSIIFSMMPNNTEIMIIANKSEILAVDLCNTIIIYSTINKKYEFKMLYSIKNSHSHVIATDNEKYLVRLKYKKDLNEIHETSFENVLLGEIIQKSGGCLSENVVCFLDLNLHEKTNDLLSIWTTLSKVADNITYLDISTDLSYLAICDSKNTLSLYRLSNRVRIGRIIIRTDVTSMILTQQYVIFATHDNRILPYLIVDPEESSHKNRTLKLKSR